MTQENFPKHPTIGFLSANIHIGASYMVWSGIFDAVAAANVNLICFPGGRLHPDESTEAMRNLIYQQVDSSQLDGLIIRALPLTDGATPQEISDFYQTYHTIPQVNLGNSFGDCPLVSIDGLQGRRALLVHLIEEHGYQQIALLRGPEDYPFAYRVYIDTLQEKGLNPDERLISPAMGWNKGVEAMSALLDERGLQPGRDFQAVVAASDLLAIDAMRLIVERGYHVPMDVAVVGFNDIEEGRFVSPPLTSVSLPFYEQGQQAVETLLALLADERVPENTLLPSRLLIRQSCDCPSWAGKVTAASMAPTPQTSQSPQTLLELQILRVTRDRVVAAAWAKQLLDAFLSEIDGDDNGRFRTTMVGMMQQGTLDGEETSAWQNTISILRSELLPTFTDSQRLQAEALFGQARVVITDAVQRAQITRQLQTEQQNRILRDIGQALITTFNVDKLVDVLAERLPELGIRSAYLALYDDLAAPLTTSSLIMAFSDNKRVGLEINGRTYPSRQLIPSDLLPDRRYSLLVEPLFFHEQLLGIVVFEVEEYDGGIYEVLRGHISTALKGALLFKKNQDYAKMLEIEVSNRTQKLQIANQQLIENAKDLEETNQELQQFAYVSSHDLQEPLRKIRLFGDRLQSHSVDKLDEKSLHYLKKMVIAAARMQTLISDLLQYSRVNSAANRFSLLALSDVVENVLEGFEDVIHDLGAEVTVRDLPTIEADRTQMWQLFQNLIGNALKFRKEGTSPQITIVGGVAPDMDGYCQITVSDNGVGFDTKFEDRVFQAFRRLHAADRFEGTGIGLAICRKVAQRHNGRIIAQSSEGGGATFIITLPYKQKGNNDQQEE